MRNYNSNLMLSSTLSKRKYFIKYAIFIFLGLFSILWILSGVIQITTEETIRVYVTGKDVITVNNEGNFSHMYLIFTSDEVFKNVDSPWHDKYNSSDLYNQIQLGEYEFTVTGYRSHVNSEYRNIIKIKSL